MTVTTGARARQIFGLRRFRLDLRQLFFEAADEHLGAEIARERLRRLGIQRRVDGHHHAAVQNLLQHDP